MAKPLYRLLGRPDREPPVWTKEVKTVFLDVKPTLEQAPALGLPVEMPFNLFMHEKEKVDLRVLTQTVGP